MHRPIDEVIVETTDASSPSDNDQGRVAESESSDCKTSGLASLFAGFFRCPTNKSENLDSADNYEEPANAQNTSHEAGGGV